MSPICTDSSHQHMLPVTDSSEIRCRAQRISLTGQICGKAKHVHWTLSLYTIFRKMESAHINNNDHQLWIYCSAIVYAHTLQWCAIYRVLLHFAICVVTVSRNIICYHAFELQKQLEKLSRHGFSSCPFWTWHPWLGWLASVYRFIPKTGLCIHIYMIAIDYYIKLSYWISISVKWVACRTADKNSVGYHPPFLSWTVWSKQQQAQETMLNLCWI